MKKSTKFKLNETLDKALSPPKRDRSKLDSLLDEYTDKPSKPLNVLSTQTVKTISDIPSTSLTRQTSLSSQTSRTTQSKNSTDIAPMRDYQKVPNSITKSAIPEGLFKAGKSKHLYDVLYSLTRGAIEPKRSLRISKTKLMKQAGIGSRITFDSIISQFEISGLIKVTVFAGEHAGNEFEVLLPEEVASLTSQSSQTSHAQILDRVVSLETSQTSQSLIVADTGISAKAKTLLKTLKQIDDEAPLISAFEKLNEAAQAATGKSLTKKDMEAFEEIIDLVINETSIARTRTKTISVYLKFAAENLRRRLYAETQINKSAKKEKANSMQVGKNELAPEPLGEFRKEALESLQNMVSKNGTEVLEIFRTGYTKEDWDWLVKNLESENRQRS